MIWIWDDGHFGWKIPWAHRGMQSSADWQGSSATGCVSRGGHSSGEILLNICTCVLRANKPHTFTQNNLLILQTSWNCSLKLLLGQVVVVFVFLLLAQEFAGFGSWQVPVLTLLHVCHLALSTATSAACPCSCCGGSSCCWGRHSKFAAGRCVHSSSKTAPQNNSRM